MNTKPIKPNGFPQQRKIDFNHYIRLILEKKWWIVLITVLFSVIWYFIYPMILDKDQQYYFSAIIRFDDPRLAQSASGLDDRFTRMETESKIRVINTTPFLTRVVDSLRLNIISRTSGLSREEIFADIDLDKANLKYGQYQLLKNDEKIDILYTNKQEEKENFRIETLQNLADSLVHFNVQGIKAAVYTDIFDKHKHIDFGCVPTRYILEGLRGNLNLNLNRQQTLLTIGYQHFDPILGTKITNAIADMFLEQALDFKRSRTTTAMAALEEQLKASKEQLEQVEERLKEFRQANPQIYLTENLAEYNRNLTANEIERDRIQNSLNRVNLLIEERNSQTVFNQRILIYQELLAFLQEQSVSGITALNQQYSSLMMQRADLVEQNFSDEHPRMIEVNRALRNLHQTIDERTAQFISLQISRLQQLNNAIQQAERGLRQSPEKELQLAKLLRERESKAQVYSSVLLRYNEIKTAHASITPDAYLLESAQIPIVYSDIMDLIRKGVKLMLGPLLGLALAIGLFIGLDFIWHRARSEEDMENILHIPVIATIPVLDSHTDVEELFESGKKMDPLLVTIDYTPSMGGDAFRNLRTKLILGKGQDEKQEIIITSLMPNEGKSLMAANLAVTFAQLKKPTLLIDADMRRGVLHNSFLCNKKPGLTDLLSKRSALNRELISQSIQKTTIPNLYLMTSGSSVPNPTELLMHEKLDKMMASLKNQFNYIIIDTPPIEFIPDAFVLNRYTHGMLIVTRYGMTNIKHLSKKLAEFPEVKDDIKGIILNASTDVLQKKYQAYSYYKY